MTDVVTLVLNEQQLDLIDRSIRAGEAADRPGLIRLALAETAAGHPTRRPIPAPPAPEFRIADQIDAAPIRTVIEDIVLEPGTGKAIELRAGQLLRIEQIDGGQCVDFNCFNLVDYREFMHAGRTRTLHGINPGAGDMLWSAPPRERAMMFISTDTAHCNDVMFPRCSANMYESVYGFDVHTNCADIQAEAIREYGLTPDDVHDSFNLFMSTSMKGTMPVIGRQTTKPGDHVELLALMDVLAVPNVCGSDVQKTSNYSISPIRLVWMQACADDLAAVPPLPTYRTQKTPRDFRQPTIRAERRLVRDDRYIPEFARVPLQFDNLTVTLTTGERRILDSMPQRDVPADDATALRDVLLTWWATSHA